MKISERLERLNPEMVLDRLLFIGFYTQLGFAAGIFVGIIISAAGGPFYQFPFWCGFAGFFIGIVATYNGK